MTDMPDKTSVAVLGTGIMGAAMARNLCGAGLDVRVWNRSREKAEPLAAEGARIADDPAAAVEGADVVLTMLHDGPTVLEVMRSATSALAPGTVWSQSSTVGLDDLEPLAAFAAEHDLVFVDAPVLGTRQPAEAGQLVVLAAGPQEARAQLAPVFDTVGSRTVWIAEDAASGAATRLKLVCNSWVLTVVNGVAEALALAEGLDVDPQGFLDAIEGGPLDCGYLRIKAGAIMSESYAPSFGLSTAGKDAQLIVEAGERGGVRLDVARANLQRFRRAERQGHGEQDMAATYFASFDGE